MQPTTTRISPRTLRPGGFMPPIWVWAVMLVLNGSAAWAQGACAAGEQEVSFAAGAIHDYEVPSGVAGLRITAAGGAGGDGEGATGGPGAVVTGTVAVAAGETLRVLVGTQGEDFTSMSNGGGGGGGSFVGVGSTNDAFSMNNLLVAAGGGGGGSGATNAQGDGGAGGTPAGGDGGSAAGGGGGGADGSGGASGDFGNGLVAGAGGSAGAGVDGADGNATTSSGGGGGAGGNGGSVSAASGGQAAIAGGAGGSGPFGTADGGFGGGGAAANTGGGGGGYAGGGGGGGGGGGSSFSSGDVEMVEMAAATPGDGFVVFCEIPAVPPAFSKAFEPATIASGGVSTLTFTIDNTASEFAAEDLAFSDPLPADVFVADPANATTTCTGGTLTATPGAATIEYTGGTVDAGVSCTISVDVTSTTPGSYDNTSGELTSSAGTSDPAVATLEVTAQMADLGISKTSTVNADDTVVFTLEATNLGPDAATGVTVTDELPTCTSYVSDDCEAGAGDPFTWTIGELAAETTVSCGVVVDASGCAGAGEQTNTANVAGDQEDPVSENDTAEATFEIPAVVPVLPIPALVALALLLLAANCVALRRQARSDT